MSEQHIPAWAFKDPQAALNAPSEFVEFLPIAVYACDADGRVRWFNQRAAQLWGREPAIGDDAELFCGSFKLYDLQGTIVRREETPMAYVLRTGEPVHGREAVVERPDGNRVFAMVHIDPIKDADGKLVGAINCFHDITELHKAREQISEGGAIIRQIFDALPIAIYTTDAKGLLTFYNRAAAELAGRKPEIGKDEWCVTWKLHTPDGQPLAHENCPMATALREERPVRGVEAIVERPDGTRIPMLPFPTPVHDRAGKLAGAVNMLVDISEQKEAESKQKMLLSELNHRVKNNMQMLHALLRSAQRETADAEAQRALSQATQRVGAMAAAQQALYDAATPVSFGIEEFMDALCRSAQDLYANEAVITREAAHGTLPNDAAMPIALILNELIANSVKHARMGVAPVQIGVALFQEGGNWRLCVTDDGPGFGAGKAIRRGSGLGLVSGLASQLCGSFRVGRESGARCIVEFPVPLIRQ
ncbi:MAG TPA: PAS domain-containing protein [Rhizomicrobium sp.]|jgi:PAS domain S-box-containing protein